MNALLGSMVPTVRLRLTGVIVTHVSNKAVTALVIDLASIVPVLQDTVVSEFEGKKMWFIKDTLIQLP